MSMRSTSSHGFSLIELIVTLLVFGIVLAISVPAFQGFSQSHQLHGAAENISGQLRLAREKAIATGVAQTIHFSAAFNNSDYHIHNGVVVEPKWKLPKGIQYYWGTGTYWEFRMSTNGRCQDSGMIILQDRRGNRDTVAVQVSGLILTN